MCMVQIVIIIINIPIHIILFNQSSVAQQRLAEMSLVTVAAVKNIKNAMDYDPPLMSSLESVGIFLF